VIALCSSRHCAQLEILLLTYSVTHIHCTNADRIHETCCCISRGDSSSGLCCSSSALASRLTAGALKPIARMSFCTVSSTLPGARAVCAVAQRRCALGDSITLTCHQQCKRALVGFQSVDAQPSVDCQCVLGATLLQISFDDSVVHLNVCARTRVNTRAECSQSHQVSVQNSSCDPTWLRRDDWTSARARASNTELSPTAESSASGSLQFASDSSISCTPSSSLSDGSKRDAMFSCSLL
jgi:hypothetical protein